MANKPLLKERSQQHIGTQAYEGGKPNSTPKLCPTCAQHKGVPRQWLHMENGHHISKYRG
jgi:hypothetical protein